MARISDVCRVCACVSRLLSLWPAGHREAGGWVEPGCREMADDPGASPNQHSGGPRTRRKCAFEKMRNGLPLKVTVVWVYKQVVFSTASLSSVNRRCPSPASFPRPACRPSRGAPCCTCQTAAWAKTTALPRLMGSTAALQHCTTSSPPRVRRTGASWTLTSKTNKIHCSSRMS